MQAVAKASKYLLSTWYAKFDFKIVLNGFYNNKHIIMVILATLDPEVVLQSTSVN